MTYERNDNKWHLTLIFFRLYFRPKTFHYPIIIFCQTLCPVEKFFVNGLMVMLIALFLQFQQMGNLVLYSLVADRWSFPIKVCSKVLKSPTI